MINKTLSDLAADYANGKIDTNTYRKNRKELLQGIVAGHIPVQPIDYLPPLEIEEEAAVTQPMARETTQMLGKSVPKGNLSEPFETNLPAADHGKSYKTLYIGVSIVIVILLIAAVVLFYPEPPSSQNTPPQAASSSAIETVDTGMAKAGEEMITAFLQQNTWNSDSLDAFLQEWNTLSFQEKNAASSTKRMQRLSSEIYNRFLEEKALMSIDSDKAIARQALLIEFARGVGIIDTRMQIER